MAERREQMRVDHLLGWLGLFLIGLLGAAYRIHDWAAGGFTFKNSGRIAAPPDGKAAREI